MKGQTKRHAGAALTELRRWRGQGLAGQINVRDRRRAGLGDDAGLAPRRRDPAGKAKRRAQTRAAKATRKAQRRRGR